MKKDIKEITQKLEKGVKEVFTSDKYKAYLDFMGKFYNYSANNIILIMMQKPEASLVAGYKAWQTKFKRQVRKGEKGITILAPCPHKFVVEKENELGIIEEREVNYMSFRATTVFDISQTDGDEVPEYISKLDGTVEGYNKLMDTLKRVSPVSVEFDAIKTGANGYYSLTEKKIVINEGMSEQQTVKTLIHEIGHSILHDKETGIEKDADRETREVQAESIAYTVCNMLGIDTSDYSFGYVAGWSKDKEAKELSESMEIIRKTVKDIFEQIKAA